jgi:signal transduction histidine kinase
VVVKVNDTGTGIDPLILPRLFTKFATSSSEGIGLGLYISKKIIEVHGGKIVVSKMAVPGMGYFAVCHDTENNSFGIWESNESAK